MKISKEKTYRTRDGKPVRIYATDADERYPIHGAILRYDYPIHGAILHCNYWEIEAWTRDGRYHHFEPGLHKLDLIEVKPKRQSKPKKPTKKAVKR